MLSALRISRPRTLPNPDTCSLEELERALDCGPDGKAHRRLNTIHLLLVGATYEVALRNSRVSERTLRLWTPENWTISSPTLPARSSSATRRASKAPPGLASWHKTKGLDWHHIEPIYLPPYSPDFNPIERLWQHLKSHHLAGYITKDGEALGEKIFQAIRSLLQTPETIRSVCRTHSK